MVCLKDLSFNHLVLKIVKIFDHKIHRFVYSKTILCNIYIQAESKLLNKTLRHDITHQGKQ